MVWAYLDGGSDDLTTLRQNREAFQRWNLPQRVLTGRFPSDLRTTVGGVELSLPVLLAPTGITGLAHWTGELGAAQAAEQAGTRLVLSTAASYTVEEVAAATRERHFFQLYPFGETAAYSSILARAKEAGYAAMVVTVDVPIHGNREGEKRYGMGTPPVLTPWRMWDAGRRPRWAYGFFRHRRISARNIVARGGAAAGVESVQEMQRRYFRPDLTWADMAALAEAWDGPFFVKGILHPDDAELAVEHGATGVIVSNHGGRQLNTAPGTLDALPAVADRIGGRAEILLDGGVRRGTDVIKALCLGASAVVIGRPFWYGLAARGPAGVGDVLRIFREEIHRSLVMMGVERLDELDRSLLTPAPASEVTLPEPLRLP